MEECLRVRVRDFYWKRPLALCVPDASLADLRSAGIEFGDAGITPTVAETLVAALLAQPCENVVELFVESHARLCDELRTQRLFHLWTARRSVRESGVDAASLTRAYTAALGALRDMVGMYLGVALLCPDTAPASRVAPSPARLIDYVLDDRTADASDAPRFRASYGDPTALLDTLDRCLAPDDLGALTTALAEAVVAVRAPRAPSPAAHRAITALVCAMVRCPHVAAALVRTPRWLGRAVVSGAAVETRTVLGVVLALSPLARLPCGVPLARALERPLARERDIAVAKTAVRDAVAAACGTARAVLESVLGGAETRAEALRWVHAALTLNSAREKMRFDQSAVASDGFLSNLSRVLVACAVNHFGSSSSSDDTAAVAVLDPCFALTHPDAVHLTDSALVGLDAGEAARYCEQRGSSASSTSTEETVYANTLFYAAFSSLHLGYVRLAQDHALVRNNCAVLRHDLETLRLDAPTDAEAQARAQRTEAQLNTYLQVYLAQDAHLADETYLDDVARLMALYARWVLSLLGPDSTDSTDREDKEDAALPPAVAVMPAVLLEDLATFFQTATEGGYCFLPEALDPVLELVVRLLASRCHLKAAFLRPKLVEGLEALMSHGNSGSSSSMNGSQRPDVQTMLETNAVCRARLVPALLQMHADVDQAKGDKVAFRYAILRVGLRVLRVPAFAASLDAYAAAAANAAAVQRFVLDLTHDVSAALTDAIDCLERVHGGDASAPLRDETRQHMGLLNVRFEFLAVFVGALGARARAALPDLAADALSGLLVFALANLVGVPSLRLKVPAPAQYGFDALQLFRWAARSTVALVDCAAFVESAARNPLATPAVFQHAYRKLRQYRVLAAPADLARFEAFAQRVGELDTAWLDGDHPDDYVDPISGALMLDPVRLPSGNVVDRTTLDRLLADSPLDPFTRLPMRPADVHPDTALRDRITAYVANLKQQQQQQQKQKETTKTAEEEEDDGK